MRSYPIKQIALDQATRRLEEAKEALSMLAGTTDFKEMEVAWSRFLISSNGVYAKVEQASKLNAKSKAWYSSKKNERKSDPLLLYLRQARNSDEHSVELITARHIDSIELSGGGSYTVDGKYGATIGSFTVSEGPSPSTKVNNPHIQLSSVHDRSQTFEPPKEHMGQPITDNSVIGIASLFITYLGRLLIEVTEIPD